MNRNLLIVPRGAPGPRLRSIDERDIEQLRCWKNSNTIGFFFRGEITPAMQAKWYEDYRARPDDYMFVIEHGGAKVGCMGFRIKEDGHADTYNMIAAPGHKGKGLMKEAMLLMCSYIAANKTKDIGCLVVTENPAIGYYVRCGYKVVGEGADHHVLKLDWSQFKPLEFDLAERP